MKLPKKNKADLHVLDYKIIVQSLLYEYNQEIHIYTSIYVNVSFLPGIVEAALSTWDSSQNCTHSGIVPIKYDLSATS